MASTIDYAKLALGADRSIRRAGRAVTLRRITNSAYDAATSKTTTATLNQNGMGVLFPYAPGIAEQSGGLIRSDDQYCLLSVVGISFEPQTGDILIVGSVQYKVMRVDLLKPAGTAVLYTLQVRKN